MLGDHRIDFDQWEPERGFCRRLWSDRVVAPMLVDGVVLVGVVAGATATYAVTHNLGATFALLLAGTAVIGSVGNYVHKRADAMDSAV